MVLKLNKQRRAPTWRGLPCGALIYVSNEPKSVLAQNLGDCRENLKNSQREFLKDIQTT